MVWARRLGWAAVALLALVLVALVAAWALFDAERTKQLAVDWVKDRYQRTLVVSQPIELGLLPVPRLKLGGVSLSERQSADIFASITSAEVVPQLWPLLRGEVLVNRIELQGVQATLVTKRDGSRNIDDLTGAQAASGPASTASAAAPAGRVAIARLRLRDVQLTMRDATGGPAGQLKLALLEADDLLSEGGLFSVAPLRLELQQLQSGTLALAGTKLAIDRLEVGGERLALQGLALSGSGRAGDLGFELGLRWPKLARQGESVTGSPLEGEFKTTGSAQLAGKLQTGAPAGDLKALRLPGLVLSAKGRAGPREVDATLKANATLQTETMALQLDGLDLQSRLVEPGLQPLALALAGQAGGTAQALRWGLKGTLNENKLESDGQLALAGKVPSVRATARFDRLDLNRVLAPAAAAASAPPTKGGAPADTPVALDGLRAVNGSFSLAAGSLLFRQYKVDEARLEAQLDGGALRVNRLTGRTWGGQIDGRGSADANGSRIALALTASGVDVNALLKDVAGKDLLEGRGRVTADVRAQGKTLGALRSSLAGTAALQLRDGAVKGVNLAKSFRQAKAALSLKQDAVSKAQADEKTDFSELNATARIENGVATSDDLDLKSPFLRVGGSGRFDIGQGRIDYTARATVIAVPQGQDAGGMASLKGVTVPVRLTGPFEAIDWKIEWSGIAAAAVEQKVKEKVKEKLGDKLKGLFGR
jgi:AsmA protein